MSRVLGIDFETTGLDTKADHIIELGAVVWDTDGAHPLDLFSCFITPPDCKLPLSEDIREFTGIKDEWLIKHGRTLAQAMDYLQKVLIEPYEIDYIVAHNGENFDRPLALAELERHGIEAHGLKDLHWIDTRTDLPFAKEPRSRSLNHLAADFEFINPFKHRAVFDVLTMLRVMSHFDFEVVAAQSRIPWVTVRALVDYNDRQKAKDLRYSWEQVGDIKMPRSWIKRVRENQLEAEQKLADEKGFKAVRVQ